MKAFDKLAQSGLGSFTDLELLEGIAGEFAPAMLQEMGLAGLIRASAHELVAAGMDKEKAFTFVATVELSRRRLASENAPLKFSDSKSISRYLIPAIGDNTQEVFVVFYLNRQNEVLAIREHFVGSSCNVTVDPAVIVRTAMGLNASAIAVGHNHPSGSTYPSGADDSLTQRLANVMAAVGLNILDHVIVTHKSWYSYSDIGLLQPMREKAAAYMGA